MIPYGQLFESIEGTACANLTCPTSPTWYGIVGSNHSETSTCGSVGLCNYETGKCQLCGGNWAYYGGTACEYLSCVGYSETGLNNAQTLCSNNGVCLNLQNFGKLRYNDNYEPDPTNYTAWDAT